MIATDVQELEPNHPLVVLRKSDESPISETTLGVIVGATSETMAEQIGLGKVTHNLTVLHTLVRGYCSDRFRELRYEHPSLSRDEANEDSLLVALNSVRRTLHQAMVRRQNQSAGSWRRVRNQQAVQGTSAIDGAYELVTNNGWHQAKRHPDRRSAQ